MRGIQTHCFEPEVNSNILNTNAFLNHSKSKNHFRAYNLAFADKTELNSIILKDFSGAVMKKILGKNVIRNGEKSFQLAFDQAVITYCIDEFCKLSDLSPTDIKIDVDGSELRLIKGMANILKRNIKRIFIEISSQ